MHNNRKHIQYLIVCIILLFNYRATPAQPLPSPSVATVRFLAPDGSTVGEQTGFFVSNRLVITAAHGMGVGRRIEVLTNEGRNYVANIVGKSDRRYDIAALDVGEEVPHGNCVLVDSMPSPGDEAILMGSTRNVTGKVIYIREDIVAGGRIGVLADFEVGMSGCPAVNKEGEVVGMLVDGYVEPDGRVAILLSAPEIRRLANELKGQPMVSPLEGAAENTTAAVRLFFLARDAGLAGDDDAERNLLAQSIERDASFWSARYALIKSHIAASKYDDAQLILKEWSEPSGMLYLQHYLQGIIEKSRGHTADAMLYFGKSLDEKRTIVTMLEIAGLYANQSKYPEAVDVLNRARAQSAQDDRPIKMLFDIAWKEHRYQDCLRLSELLVTANATASAHVLRGRAMLATRDYENVVRIATEDQGEYPDEIEFYVICAMAHMGMSNSEQAVSKLEEAVARDSQALPAWKLLAKISDQVGNKEKAVYAYEHCIELAPDDGALLYDLGLAYVRSGQKDRAGALVEKLRILAPKSAIKLESLTKDR